MPLDAGMVTNRKSEGVIFIYVPAVSRRITPPIPQIRRNRA